MKNFISTYLVYIWLGTLTLALAGTIVGMVHLSTPGPLFGQSISTEGQGGTGIGYPNGWKAGYVAIGNGTSTMSTSTAAYVDTVNNLLGVGSSTPSALLAIGGNLIGYNLFDIGTTSGSKLKVTNGGQTSTCIDVIGGTGSKFATSTAMVLDWPSLCNEVDIKVGPAAFSLTLINASTSAQAGGRKLLNIQNPTGGTAGAATINGCTWYTNPTQTTAAGRGDTYSLHVMTATTSIASPWAYTLMCAATPMN